MRSVARAHARTQTHTRTLLAQWLVAVTELKGWICFVGMCIFHDSVWLRHACSRWQQTSTNACTHTHTQINTNTEEQQYKMNTYWQCSKSARTLQVPILTVAYQLKVVASNWYDHSLARMIAELLWEQVVLIKNAVSQVQQKPKGSAQSHWQLHNQVKRPKKGLHSKHQWDERKTARGCPLIWCRCDHAVQ